MPASAWKRREACVAAGRVFGLAEGYPVLRPSSLSVAADAAASLGERDGSVPRPPQRWLAEMREGTADAAPGPLDVLAILLHPQSVWSIDEALGAQRLAPSTLPLATCLGVLVSFARAGVGSQDRERARRVAKPVAQILPLEQAPRTSRDLDDALALLRRPRCVDELCEHLLLT